MSKREAKGLLQSWAVDLKPTTRRTYGSCLEDFARFANAGDVVSAMTWLIGAGKQAATHTVRAYKADLVERRELAPNTVNTRLAALRSFLGFCEESDVINWSLRVKPMRVTVLRDVSGPGIAALRAMVDQARQKGGRKGLRDVAILRLLFDLGLRRAEVIGLNMVDVDLVSGRIQIRDWGRSEGRWVVLPTETSRALVNWLAVRGEPRTDAVFVGPSYCSRGRISGQGFYAVIRKAGQTAAGVLTSPNRIRRSSITAACELEPDLGRVQCFSRHSSHDMVQRYRDGLDDVGGEIASKVAVTL